MHPRILDLALQSLEGRFCSKLLLNIFFSALKQEHINPKSSLFIQIVNQNPRLSTEKPFPPFSDWKTWRQLLLPAFFKTQVIGAAGTPRWPFTVSNPPIVATIPGPRVQAVLLPIRGSACSEALKKRFPTILHGYLFSLMQACRLQHFIEPLLPARRLTSEVLRVAGLVRA